MNTNLKCDFCGAIDLDFVYTPINSARGVQVHVCNHCGLVQSITTSDYVSRPPGSMSADANRSSYRYTKDVISGRYDEIFANYVDFATITNVLDVGSNRGAFINYLENNHQGKFIEAIEPDASIVKEYTHKINVNVQVCRFEYAELPTNHFDFAYCAHTLEHASSARLMLYEIGRALKPCGKFFLAVPNLLFYDDVIEEIFIDPHVYHFNYPLLKECVEQSGFVIEYASSPQEHEIIFLLRKIGSTFEQKIFLPINVNLANQNKESINNYHLKILKNRESLRESVELLNQASLNYKIVVWGGGRIFDALVRFGHLDVSKIFMVVDKYLYRYVEKLYGRPLVSPDVLEDLDATNILVYIASREYAVEIEEEARKLGIRNFIRFGEIFYNYR